MIEEQGPLLTSYVATRFFVSLYVKDTHSTKADGMLRGCERRHLLRFTLRNELMRLHSSLIVRRRACSKELRF